MAFPAGVQRVGGTALKQVPMSLPGDNRIGANAIWPTESVSTAKFAMVSPGQRRGIPYELLPAQQETVQGDFPMDYSRVTKWMPRGQSTVPTSNTVPVTLISARVPEGSRYWLEWFHFNLTPSARESSFYWQILADGIDLLNYGAVTAYPGRPVASAMPVPFGSNRDEQPCLKPGTLIEVNVLYIGALNVATDVIEATICGSLEGVRP